MAVYINREALLQYIKKSNPYMYHQLAIITNIMPPADVVPVVHARWIGGKYYNDVYGYEKTCTACGKEYVVGFDYLYCPYCGAKMDGGMKDEG